MSTLSLFSSTEVVVLTALARDSLSMMMFILGGLILKISLMWDESKKALSHASAAASVSAAIVERATFLRLRLFQLIRLALNFCPIRKVRFPP